MGRVGHGTGFTRSGDTSLAGDIISRDQLSLPLPTPPSMGGHLCREPRCLGSLEGGGLGLDLADTNSPREAV